jgi:hypothetical protein
MGLTLFPANRFATYTYDQIRHIAVPEQVLIVNETFQNKQRITRIGNPSATDEGTRADTAKAWRHTLPQQRFPLKV